MRVKDISLGIEENSFVLIKGRSGAGKSTLLHLIGGLIRPTSGSVRIGNDIINELDNRSLSAILASKTGIIFQSFNLLPTYDLYENVEIALAPAGLTDNEMKRIILPCFEQFGMSDKLYSCPGSSVWDNSKR
jgi:putative ABC transport system ATP-binding protein